MGRPAPTVSWKEIQAKRISPHESGREINKGPDPREKGREAPETKTLEENSEKRARQNGDVVCRTSGVPTSAEFREARSQTGEESYL